MLEKILSIDLDIQDPRWDSSIHNIPNWCQNTLEVTLQEIPLSLGPVNVGIILSDDDLLHKLNHHHRQKDKPTNVLSFPVHHGMVTADMLKNFPEPLLGDIVISWDRVLAESCAQEKTFYNHGTHLLIHGFLHLLGYDHENDIDGQEMENQEIKILDILGISNPYKDEA
jgi:probable rRNA maturation factor